MKENKNFFNILPNELIKLIFSFLDPLNLVRVLAVCRKWRVHATDDTLWQSLYEQSLYYQALIRGQFPNLFFKLLHSKNAFTAEEFIESYLLNAFQENTYKDGFGFIERIIKGFSCDSNRSATARGYYRSYLGFWQHQEIKNQLIWCATNGMQLKSLFIDEGKKIENQHQILITILLKLQFIEQALLVPLIFYKMKSQLFQPNYRLDPILLKNLPLSGYLALIERFPLAILQQLQKETKNQFIYPDISIVTNKGYNWMLAEAIAGCADDKWIYIYQNAPSIAIYGSHSLEKVSDQIILLLPLISPNSHLPAILRNSTVAKRLNALLGEFPASSLIKLITKPSNIVPSTETLDQFKIEYTTTILSYANISKRLSSHQLRIILNYLPKNVLLLRRLLQENSDLMDQFFQDDEIIQMILNSYTELSTAIIDDLMASDALSLELATTIACQSDALAKKILSLRFKSQWKKSQLEQIANHYPMDASIQMLLVNHIKKIESDIEHEDDELVQLTRIAHNLLRR